MIRFSRNPHSPALAPGTRCGRNAAVTTCRWEDASYLFRPDAAQPWEAISAQSHGQNRPHSGPKIGHSRAIRPNKLGRVLAGAGEYRAPCNDNVQQTRQNSGGDRRSMRTRANGTHNGAARTATINVACGPLDSTFVIDLTTQRGVFRFSLNFLVHKRLCLCPPMVEWRRRCEVNLASIVTGRRRPTIPDRTTRSIASYPRHGVARLVTRLRRSQEVPLSVVPIQRTVNPPHCIQAAHVHLELPCTRYSDGHMTIREDIRSRIQALRSTPWPRDSQAGRGTMLLASVRCNQ